MLGLAGGKGGKRCGGGSSGDDDDANPSSSITTRRLHKAVQALGSPLDLLALAHLAGGGGGERGKSGQRRQCSYKMCSSHNTPNPTPERPLKCSRCGTSYYCKSGCQKLALPTHECLCRLLAETAAAAAAKFNERPKTKKT